LARDPKKAKRIPEKCAAKQKARAQSEKREALAR
jgi:hypothetical protein